MDLEDDICVLMEPV